MSLEILEAIALMVPVTILSIILWGAHMSAKDMDARLDEMKANYDEKKAELQRAERKIRRLEKLRNMQKLRHIQLIDQKMKNDQERA